MSDAEEPLPSPVELTARIARSIGIWETNRTGSEPKPQESALDTVAGVHASMATIEQATMPYTVDAFAKFGSLREQASPPLTKEEISKASTCCKAVVRLLGSVEKAVEKGTDPAQFIKANKASIEATFLSNEDLRTMFRAVGLKQTISSLHDEVKAKKITLDKAALSIPQNESLGIGTRSLKSYVNKESPKDSIWGENRAAWQRKAVLAMPDRVGSRMEQVAVSGKGTALVIPVVRARVDAELACHPSSTAKELIKEVARQNNSRERNYGQNVLKIYGKLFPSTVTSQAKLPSKPTRAALSGIDTSKTLSSGEAAKPAKPTRAALSGTDTSKTPSSGEAAKPAKPTRADKSAPAGESNRSQTERPAKPTRADKAAPAGENNRSQTERPAKPTRTGPQGDDSKESSDNKPVKPNRQNSTGNASKAKSDNKEKKQKRGWGIEPQ
jgi:hypothetical protein